MHPVQSVNESYWSWICSRIVKTGETTVERSPRRRSAARSVVAAEIQSLEERVVLSTSAPGFATPAVQNQADVTTVEFGPLTSAAPRGYTPAQVKHAYGFDQITINGTVGNGAGTTIAIVNAYDDPNIASDLHQFSLAFGLPDPPSFTKVNQSGSTTSLPAANASWITEIALDVEWAHAIAPGANILLVEANSNSFSDLFAAVSTARNYPGVVVVSMSWGASEYSTEKSGDIQFVTPANHAGVTFVAASGDSGAPGIYPATSPNVVGVGGTTLRLDTGGSMISEAGWGGSGGGISRYESQPAYQQGVVTQSSTMRTSPDVSYDSDPSTGFGVYDSYNNGTTSPWGQWGGTSAAAPQWAALIAIADQNRAFLGMSSLDGATQTLPLLYSMPASNFHDITSGSSTGSPNYAAAAGYDLVTGRGTPYANLVVRSLAGLTSLPRLTSIATLGTAAPQIPFSVSYATLLAASDAASTNGQPIQFRISSIQSGTLSIVHNNVTTPVVASLTNGSLFVAGDTLIWTGAIGSSGNGVNAFSVTAFDGVANSATAVQVKINMGILGTQFDLSGSWVVMNSSGAPLGLGTISQVGGTLALVNASGFNSSAQYSSSNQITSPNLNNLGPVGGTIDTTTANQGRIVWSDGTAWLRNSLGGQYAVLIPGSSVSVLGSIVQNGTSLTFVIGISSVSATISSLGQLAVTGQPAGAVYGDGQMTFAATGQVWTKLDLPPDYTNAGGAATHVIQNGTTGLVFVDKFGGTSPGFWISATQLYASLWNQIATTGRGTLTWDDGTVWTENLMLNGSVSGAGAARVTAQASLISVNHYVNSAGKAVHVVLTGTTSLAFIDSLGNIALGSWISSSTASSSSYQGDVATFIGNKVVWASGGVWTQVNNMASAVTVADYTNAKGSPMHIVQNGTSTLVFINAQGTLARGTWLNPTQAVSTTVPGDKATFSGTIVTWDNGDVWTRVYGSLSPLVVTDYVNQAGVPVHILMTGSAQMLFVDGLGHMVPGTMINSLQATSSDYPGDVANITANRVLWASGGIWTLVNNSASPCTVTDYINLAGQAVHTVQNGTNSVIFIGAARNISRGTWLNMTQASANSNPTDKATFGSTTVTWDDGDIWTKSTRLPVFTTFTDASGNASHLQILNGKTLIGLDGSLQGATGALQNGVITWSNGAVWNNFDFNGLHSLFLMDGVNNLF